MLADAGRACRKAKRDLAKLGVTALEQLNGRLPPGIRCRVKVTLRKDDDGNEYNRVKRFEVVGIDEPPNDAFAPTDTPEPPQDVRHRQGRTTRTNPKPPQDVAGGAR